MTKDIEEKAKNAVADIRDGVLMIIASQIVLLGADALLAIHAPLLLRIPLIGLATSAWAVVAGLLTLGVASIRRAIRLYRET